MEPNATPETYTVIEAKRSTLSIGDEFINSSYSTFLVVDKKMFNEWYDLKLYDGSDPILFKKVPSPKLTEVKTYFVENKKSHLWLCDNLNETNNPLIAKHFCNKEYASLWMISKMCNDEFESQMPTKEYIDPNKYNITEHEFVDALASANLLREVSCNESPKEYLIKAFDENKRNFIENNFGTRLAIQKNGRFGTLHWEPEYQKGDYQKLNKINDDTQEGCLAKIYDSLTSNNK